MHCALPMLALGAITVANSQPGSRISGISATRGALSADAMKTDQPSGFLSGKIEDRMSEPCSALPCAFSDEAEGGYSRRQYHITH